MSNSDKPAARVCWVADGLQKLPSGAYSSKLASNRYRGPSSFRVETNGDNRWWS